MRYAEKLQFGIVPLLIAGVTLLAGCDGSTTGPDMSTRTVEGTVTDDEGYGKRAGSVEGVAVTAVSVTAEGSTQPLDGSAETNASGQYELQVTDPSTSMIVRAEGEGDFQAQTLVQMEQEGSGTVQAMPMNGETSAEADVYVEARSDGGSAVTKSDVALYVDQHLAGEIESGGTTVAEVAQSIRAQIEAEHQYAAENTDSGEEKAEEGRSNKVEAFAALESDLAASTSASAQSEALARLESSVMEAYTEAGVSAEVAAQARMSGHSFLRLKTESAQDSSDALFALRKRSKVMASTALARAIEASFQAEGAADSRLQTLAEARSKLIGELRAASSAEAMTQARAEFESTVESELASQIGVTVSAIDSAQTAVSGAKSTLEAALSLGASASSIASAHATFFGNAESTLSSELQSSSNAELAASVVALLAVK